MLCTFSPAPAHLLSKVNGLILPSILSHPQGPHCVTFPSAVFPFSPNMCTDLSLIPQPLLHTRIGRLYHLHSSPFFRLSVPTPPHEAVLASSPMTATVIRFPQQGHQEQTTPLLSRASMEIIPPHCPAQGALDLESGDDELGCDVLTHLSGSVNINRPVSRCPGAHPHPPRLWTWCHELLSI